MVIHCLNTGYILHEERNDINIKNILSTGAVTIADIASIIGRSRGNQYSCSPHHYDENVDVHVIISTISGINRYIKWYFIEPNCIFISVHH